MTMKHTYRLPFTGGDVELVHGVDASHPLYRTVRVLEAMLWGYEVHNNGFRFRLAEGEEGLVVVTIHGEAGDEHVLGHPNATLGYLSQVAAHMSDVEFDRLCVGVAASKTLTSINRKDRPDLATPDNTDPAHRGCTHE